MRAVSADFTDAVYRTHSPVVTANVLTATESLPIEVIGGSVTLDATAESRGALDLLVPPEYAPATSSDMLAPYGNEIQVFRGIKDVGSVSLGIYRIESMTDTADGVSIVGLDRSIRCIEAVFEKSCEVRATYGVLITDAIQNMLTEAYPTVSFRFGTSPYQVPSGLVVEEGDDRWDVCRGLAEGLGCLLYFDADGVATLHPVPVGSPLPVASVVEGGSGSLLSASREWDRQDAKNKWIVTGNTEQSSEGAGVTPRGEAAQDTGPTTYGGPFGKVPDFYSNDVIRTHDHATYVAATRRALYGGITQRAPFESLPNPVLEPLDTVRLTRADAALDDDVIIDSLVIPLGSEPMSAVTRSVLLPP